MSCFSFAGSTEKYTLNLRPINVCSETPRLLYCPSLLVGGEIMNLYERIAPWKSDSPTVTSDYNPRDKKIIFVPMC